MLKQSFYHRVNGCNTGSAVIKRRRNFSGMLPEITFALVHTFVLVNASHKLSPADYLPDKTFR